TLEPAKILGQLSVIGRPSLESRKNVPSVPESRKRLVARALPRFDHGHKPVTQGQVALPAGISSIRCGETFSDRVRGFIAVERRAVLTLSPRCLADVLVADGEVAVPASIGGVCGGKAFHDRA